MENNRRAFFKGIAAFAAGVVGARVSSYIPKKEEPKEEIMVSNTLTINHEGEHYHPLVVKKTDMDKMEVIQPKNPPSIAGFKQTLRKAKI